MIHGRERDEVLKPTSPTCASATGLAACARNDVLTPRHVTKQTGARYA